MDVGRRRAADIVLVTEAVALIAQTSDHGTLEEYSQLLHPDVVWEMSANPATGLSAQVHRGRDAMLAGVAARREAGGQGPGSMTRHVVSTAEIDPEGDYASSLSFWRFYVDTDRAPLLKSTGVYRDQFVRGADGRWRLRHRRGEVG
jgi:ketosteroid isomerase-like protein